MLPTRKCALPQAFADVNPKELTMSGSHNLSAYIVDKCKSTPRFAFVLIPLGGFIACFALADAKFYQALRDKPALQMKVERIYDAPNSRGFSAPHVAGKTPQGEVNFPISQKEARRIQEGQDLQFVATSSSTIPYVTRDTLETQLAEIYFSAAGYPVNAIGLLGFAVALGGLGWGLFAKPKPTVSVNSTSNESV
jgi:hypothetical protein